MALVLKDRVQETSTTAGTGTLTLAGAIAGFQAFSAIGNGNTTYYSIVDSTVGTWEVGIGTYTASGTTLSRDTVLASSNGGSLVSFTSAAKSVFCTYPSEKGVWLDASGNVVQTSYGAITATSIALTTGTISTAPSNSTDITNKLYVDNTLNSVNYHAAANYATTADLGAVTYNNGTSGVGATITKTTPFATLLIDGANPTVGQRILVKNETSGQYNGVYTVTNVGSVVTGWILTRATDYDQTGTGANEIAPGDYIFVISGTANANTAWIQSTDSPITIGTTPIAFVQVAGTGTYSAGTGLTLSSNTFSITNTGTAGTYGSASTVPVFVTNAQGQVTSVTNTSIAISGSQITSGTVGTSYISGSYTGITGVGTLTAGVWNGTAIVTTYGGTGVTSYTAGDLVYYASGTALSKLAIGSANYVLTSSGTAPQYVAQSTLTVGSATTATNIAGGAANQIHYQSAASTTTFITAPSSSGTVLNWNGSTFTWVNGTISGVSLGSNLNTLTFGTYLAAGGSSYNGSSAVTISTNATSANTASTLVARDASGNFSAGTITASLSGNATTSSSTTGNSATTSQTNFSNLTIGGSQVLYAGNYTSYSPSLTGSGASGTWGINITGNAATATNGLTTGNYNSYAPTLTGGGASGTWGINITGNSGNTSSVSNATGGSYTWTNTNYFQSNQNTGGGSSPPLEAYSTGGNGAIMAFHRGGVYAVNMGLDSDNVFRIGGWSASYNLLQMDMSGNLTMLNNVTAYSDETLKKDWKDLPNDFVEKLANVKNGTYTRIDSGLKQVGVGAQSLQPVMPEAVLKDNSDILSVSYGNAALAACVELAKEIVALKARILELENK